MENLLYLIEINNKVIGVYNNLTEAEYYIYGSFQNNFFKEANVLVYRPNTCFRVETKKYLIDQSVQSSPSNYLNKSSTKPVCFDYHNDPVLDSDDSSKKVKPNPVKKQINDNDEVFLEMAKQKIDLQHKINMLKVQKEKMEESKRVYDNDVKLFNLFSESKSKDPSFKIPELFEKKYEIMDKLKESNNLSWETFTKEYKIGDNNYGDYFESNNYEELFLESDTPSSQCSKCSCKTDTPFSEELDIESDSSTEDSEDNINK